MRRHLFAALSSICVALGCGGKAGSEQNERVPIERPRTPDDAGAAAPTSVPTIIPPPNRPPVDSSVYEDPGCPPPTPMVDAPQCDPLAEETGCAEGEACYPFVIYPTGPCGVERYGAWCTPAGDGRQGDSCARGGCAPGHVCVSTGEGTECVQLCALSIDQSRCPAGLLCLPIDIEGFGGCL